jgi:hypothetical protein
VQHQLLDGLELVNPSDRQLLVPELLVLALPVQVVQF